MKMVYDNHGVVEITNPRPPGKIVFDETPSKFDGTLNMKTKKVREMLGLITEESNLVDGTT